MRLAYRLRDVLLRNWRLVETQEPPMNVFRVSFLIVTDALVLLMLVAVLTGCASTSPRYRNGDFVSHRASTQVYTTRASAQTDARAATQSDTNAAAPVSATRA